MKPNRAKKAVGAEKQSDDAIARMTRICGRKRARKFQRELDGVLAFFRKKEGTHV